jgi:serine/threonine protein kinase/Tol biopolymer transport system component
MPLAAGTRLGPYEILAPIGAGGMGEVYRARDTKLGRDVALKVLPESFARDPERMARFEREAHVLASLNHPNIATVYGFEAGAIGMELVEGPTLTQRIGGRPLPLDEALPIAKQIAEGLEYAHEKGVIHRDLKPANVKLTADGNVKVLDFGLAKALELRAAAVAANPSISPTLMLSGTQAGLILGTAAYMAPEQARGAAVDRRADIWAYGVVLYEMLSGKQPFIGPTVSDTLAAVLKTEPEWDAIPLGMRRLVRRCMEKNPKRRLRDIGEARVLIEDLLTGSPEEQPASAPKAGRFSTPIRFAHWVLTSALLLTTLVISWVYLHQSAPAERVIRATITLPAKALVHSFALSPDGRYFVLAAQVEEAQRLWLRRLDDLDPLPLPGTEEAQYPFWSPDSRYIGFFAQGKLKKIAVTGGPAQILCDAQDGRGGTWNREGLIVFAPTGAGASLQRVSAAGGAPTGITHAEGGAVHRFPIFLPDGHRLLYLASTSKTIDRNGISLAALDSKESRRLLPDASNASYVPPVAAGRPAQILFVRNSTLMAQPVNPETLQLAGEALPIVENIGQGLNAGVFKFSVSGDDSLTFQAARAFISSQLAWFDRNGVQGGVVGKSGYIADFSISPDGKKVALTRNSSPGQLSGSEIWLHELERDTESRFTFKGYNFGPVWSPDGSSIAYVHSTIDSSTGEVYQKQTSGAGHEELLAQGKITPVSWSRDGRFLILTSFGTSSGADLLVMPFDGERKPVPFVASDFQEYQGRFSPDGTWITYTSNESGRMEIYAEPYPRGSGGVGKRKVSTDGGEESNWRPDGKELFYLDPGGRLLAVPVRNSGQKSGFSIGAPIALFDTHLLRFERPAYRVAPDGKSFLVRIVRERGADPPLVLVTNWHAGLAK